MSLFSDIQQIEHDLRQISATVQRIENDVVAGFATLEAGHDETTVYLESIANATVALVTSNQGIIDKLQELIDVVKGEPPPRPGPVSVQLLREENAMLVYGLQLPPPGATDVVTREVSEVVGGGAPRVFPGTDGMELSYTQGDAVDLTLVDIDDAGNRSPASPPFSFVATDTIAPPQAGQLGVTLLREEP